MADDVGYECLGSYGGTSYETPNLDALAASGMQFANCFSTPKCSPSRVTIMSGRYTLRTTTTWGLLPENEITFGNLLLKRGARIPLARIPHRSKQGLGGTAEVLSRVLPDPAP